MELEEPLYNLKAVVQQTGIPAASLRAWEKRYGLLAPVRKPNGHRLYPASEIEKLLRVKAMMARGMTISQAADQVRHQAEPPTVASEVERLRTQLGLALAEIDARRANQLFGEALDLLTLEQVCVRIIRPLLPVVAPFGRTYLRSRLGAMLLQGAWAPGSPTALVMSPDPADLQPLLAAVFLSRRGHHVIYVEGTEPPAMAAPPDLVIDPRQWGEVPPEQLFR